MRLLPSESGSVFVGRCGFCGIFSEPGVWEAERLVYQRLRLVLAPSAHGSAVRSFVRLRSAAILSDSADTDALLRPPELEMVIHRAGEGVDGSDFAGAAVWVALKLDRLNNRAGPGCSNDHPAEEYCVTAAVGSSQADSQRRRCGPAEGKPEKREYRP